MPGNITRPVAEVLSAPASFPVFQLRPLYRALFGQVKQIRVFRRMDETPERIPRTARLALPDLPIPFIGGRELGRV